MKYDFDSVIDRRNTSCLKWDYLTAFFKKDNLNSMWVADMDFIAPPEILTPIRERVEHGIFGYTAKPDEFYTAVIGWFKRRYCWNIKRDWIVTAPGVVPTLNLAIQEFTEVGDRVIIQPPVYFPFKESVELNQREAVDNQLILRKGRYEIDWQDLEEKAESSTMLVFCSPHNPVSRVWTMEELQRLGDICQRNDLLVFSDEIHADIVFRPKRHIPTPVISHYLRSRTLAAYATSKTFNLAGLQMSINVIPNEDLRKRFIMSIKKLHMSMSNIFGIVGTQAAYSKGDQWLDELLLYLWKNFETVRNYIDEFIPAISVIEPDGTYLIWLDCRRLEIDDEKLAEFFVHEAGLALSPGIMFGPGGSGFMRMNIGCPRKNIVSALKSLKEAVTLMKG